MKKVILFVAVVAAISFASCKKDRTCTCTDANGTQVYTITKVSKGDAKKICIDQSRTNNGVTQTTTCKLN